MEVRGRAHWLRRSVSCAALLALLHIGLPGGSSAAQAPPPLETRALWVLRTSLTSPDRIDRLVREAANSGFNTLFLQVRARGDAFYAGGIEPTGAGVAAGFDPLAHGLRSARAAGLRVHVWINVNLVASAVTVPTERSHVVRAHPEWLMVPRELGASLARRDPRDPSYVATLAWWTRKRRDRVEGLYASPVAPGAAKYLEDLVRDLVRRYPVDGVHLDYVRFPSTEFDYSASALAAFRESVRPDLTPAERTRLDARLARDPLVYANTFPQRWTEFRRLRLADLVARIRGAVRAERPDALLSAAVYPDPEQAAAHKLQDWASWARRGLIDAVCPMAYTTSLPQFRRQIVAASRAADPQPLWAGIGAYRLTPAATAAHIAAARRSGARGIVLFSYDSLVDAPRRDSLGDIGRAAFTPARASADLP